MTPRERNQEIIDQARSKLLNGAFLSFKDFETFFIQSGFDFFSSDKKIKFIQLCEQMDSLIKDPTVSMDDANKYFDELWRPDEW